MDSYALELYEQLTISDAVLRNRGNWVRDIGVRQSLEMACHLLLLI